MRDATILAWWAACSDGFKVAVRALYAQALGCSLHELCDLNTFAQDSDVLDWMAMNYAHTIDGWVEDQL